MLSRRHAALAVLTLVSTGAAFPLRGHLRGPHKFTEAFYCRRHIDRVGGFGSWEASQILIESLSNKAFPTLCYPTKASGAKIFSFAIHVVLRARCVAQIDPSVVGLDAIDVVNILCRPFARHAQEG